MWFLQNNYELKSTKATTNMTKLNQNSTKIKKMIIIIIMKITIIKIAREKHKLTTKHAYDIIK